jgi:hypothetical protein
MTLWPPEHPDSAPPEIGPSYLAIKSTKDSKYYTFNIGNESIVTNVIGAYFSKPLNQKVLRDSHVMGRFTIGKGWDKEKNDAYVSIYDKWDLPFSDYVPNSIGGKPFEIYDRYYYKDLKEHLFKTINPKQKKDYDNYNRIEANLRSFFDQSHELLYDKYYDRDYESM